MTIKKAARLGRPPASRSIETRQRIIDVAMEAFAESGYGATTNKHVATKAGITTGALYHYFDSKLAMYIAVYDEVQAMLAGRFDEAMRPHQTFVGQFTAVLETAHQLNRENAALARFVRAARIDMSRHDELAQSMVITPGEGVRFTEVLIKTGIASGEFSRSQRDEIRVFIRTVLVGLVDAVSGDLKEHRLAIDAFVGLVNGTLIKPASRSRTVRRPR